MNPHLQRALLLFDQSRHDMAADELRLALAEDPGDARAHALLALCLVEKEDFKGATEEARQAIHLDPGLPFAHRAHAKILLARERPDEAREAIAEAIRLDPEDPDQHALMAAIEMDLRHWSAALEAAERGLHFDATHVGCANLRAMALVKLGRRAEAGITLGGALERDPENALTHANQGWALLHEGKHEKALGHFREALRLDPQQDWARHGIVEALKARHFIYAAMLKYFLWMSRLNERGQWGVILGAYIGYRVLGGIASSNPAAAPFIWPVLILYLVFALMTWLADPLFNLVLRLNRFGKLVLSPEQTTASNWIGGCILAALIALVVWLVASNGLAGYAALALGPLVLPLAASFKCPEGWPRRAMFAGTAALALLAIATLVDFQFGGMEGRSRSTGLLTIFFLGCGLSGLAANILMSVRMKR